jgi:hypothetical protein
MYCRRVVIGLVVSVTLLMVTIPSLPVYAWGDSDGPDAGDLKAEVAPAEAGEAASDLPEEAVILSSSGASQQACWRDDPNGSLVIENCPAHVA